MTELDPSEFCVLYCTVPDDAAARKITDALIGERLAACVSCIPGAESVYRWEGEICRGKEIILMIKSKRSLYGDIESVIKKHHPYTVPEIIACPISEANFQYLDWIDESTR